MSCRVSRKIGVADDLAAVVDVNCDVKMAAESAEVDRRAGLPEERVTPRALHRPDHPTVCPLRFIV